MNDLLPLAIALVAMIGAFAYAVNNGVVKLLTSGCAAFCSLIVFFAGFHFYPLLSDSLSFLGDDLSMRISISAILALVTYIVSLLIFGAIIKALFNQDGMLHFLVDGIPGGIVSLFPSLVAVLFFFICIRIVGTLKELNYTASLSQPGIEQTLKKIPGYPISSRWRNGIESIGPLATVLDQVDPFSNRSNRNAAALAMMSKSAALQNYISKQPEVAGVSESVEIQALKDDLGIQEALSEQQRLGLVLNPTLRQVASLPELSRELRKLKLRPVLTGFAETLQLMYKKQP